MDQLPIECKFLIIACQIEEFIELLEREGFIEQARCVRLQFEEQLSEQTCIDNRLAALKRGEVVGKKLVYDGEVLIDTVPVGEDIAVSAKQMLENGINDGSYANILDDINVDTETPFFKAVVQFAEDFASQFGGHETNK